MPDKPENSAFKLLSSRKTLVMATADKSGAPNVSHAPFVHRAPPLAARLDTVIAWQQSIDAATA